MEKRDLLMGGEACRAVPSPPERIVSPTPGASELICVLGGLGRIVGRDDQSNFSPGLDEKPVAGSSIRKTIRVEQIVYLGPDVLWPKVAAPGIFRQGPIFLTRKQLVRLGGLIAVLFSSPQRILPGALQPEMIFSILYS